MVLEADMGVRPLFRGASSVMVLLPFNDFARHGPRHTAKRLALHLFGTLCQGRGGGLILPYIDNFGGYPVREGFGVVYSKIYTMTGQLLNSTDWNRAAVLHLAGEFEAFTVQTIAEWHLRLTRTKDGAKLDYYPKSRKACWLGFKTQTFFKIPDIEKYLIDKFL